MMFILKMFSGCHKDWLINTFADIPQDPQEGLPIILEMFIY